MHLHVFRLLQRRPVLSVIAHVLLVTLTWLLVSPTVLAAQTRSPSPPRSSPAAPTPGEEMAFPVLLAQMEATLSRWQEHLERSEGARLDPAELAHVRQRLAHLETRARQQFTHMAQHLQVHNLPEVMQQRHRDAVAAYQAAVATLRQQLDDLGAATTPQTRRDKAAKAVQHLRAIQPPRAPQALEPDRLPFRTPEGTIRPARETTKDYETALTPPPLVMTASSTLLPGMLAAAPLAPLSATPTPDDLAPTEEVVLTAEIRALAASLGNHPVRIFNWVHDHIEFLPTSGSIQGAHMTMQTQRGNASDTASLLIALLRAARIPARYVYGTVQIPIAQVMNWVGGVPTPEAALQVLGQGGIPHTGLVQGGVLTAVKLEHLWVDAWIDFFPSQGAQHVQGDTWIPLDASFKQSPATAVQAPQPLVRDAVEALAAPLLASAQRGADGATVTGFDLAPLTTLWQDTPRQLLGAYPPATPLRTVLGQRTIVPSGRPVLAAGLPYQLIVRGGTQRALTAAQRHYVRLALFTAPLGSAGTSPVLTMTRSLPSLQAQRLSVTYAPATPADAALLDSLQAQGAAVLPVYLLQGIPLLQLDGVTVASGPPLPLGQRVAWQVTLTGPQDTASAPMTFRGRVGDELVLALNGSGVAPAAVLARLARPDPRTAAEDLHLTGLQYWLASDAVTTLTAQLQGAYVTRLPSVALVGQPLVVTSVLGLPYTGTYQGHSLDVGRSLLAVGAPDAATRRAVVWQSSVQASALAGSVLESTFGRPQGTSRSAVSLLALAHQQGLPLATLTAANVATALPQLQVPAALAPALREAVAAGYWVLVPGQPPQHGAVPAAGYVLLDPRTGAGGSLLAEGVHGGVQPDCQTHLTPAVAPAVFPAVATVLAGLVPPAPTALDTPAAVWLTTGLLATLGVPAVTAVPGPQPTPVGDLAALLVVEHVLARALAALTLVAAGTSADCVTDTTPPVVSLSGVPPTAAVGRPLVFTVTATDDGRVASLGLRVHDQPQILDPAGRATYTPQAVGTYTVVALAQDGAGHMGQAQATFQAIDATQDTTPPVVTLHPLNAEAPVTAPTVVRGLVQDETLVRWTLALTPQGEERLTTLATGTTVPPDGVFGLLDPTLLRNDLYELRLTAEDANGRLTTITLVVQVSGGMKVGHLSFTLEDLSLPMVGLPITIHRTYDSRDTAVGDFGVGWRLDIQTLRLRTGRPLGTDWAQGSTGVTFPVSYCLERDPQRIVTLTLPDGHQEVFDFMPTTSPGSRTSVDFGNLPEWCQWLVPIQFATAAYTPRPGTLGTLEALADPELWIVGGLSDAILLLSLATLDVYAPRRWRYTTPEGLQMEIEQGVGVQKLTEPNGHTLTFGRDGILHSAGPSVRLTRDAQGRVTQITDPMGHTLTYAYDGAGDLVAVTDQEGHTTRYQYDATHKLVAIADPRGVTVARNLYDNAGRMIAHLDAEGNRVDYTHDISGRREVVTDRLGQTTTYTYDDRGHVLSFTNSLGYTTTFAYDAHGRQLMRTNPLGETIARTYDAQGNTLTIENPLGHTIVWTYDTRNRLLTHTDPHGHTTGFTYDRLGNLLTSTDALGHVTTYAYDASGQHMATTDATGQTTQYTYDAAGRRVRSVDALGRATTYRYDANGNLLAETTTRTDAGGTVVSMTTQRIYDKANRVIAEIDPLGQRTAREYNVFGKVSAQVDASGHRTQYLYDARGQLVQTLYPDGTHETATYDVAGNRHRWTDRAGRTTTSTYDALHRLVQTTYPDGKTSSMEYDAADRVTSIIDAHGNRTAYAYDAAGRRTAVIDALGQSTTMTYDAQGNLTSVTDARGSTMTYGYDARHQRISTRFPDATASSRQYDALGRKIAETDQQGHMTTFAYDVVGQLINVTNALGGITTYTYDEVGNLVTQTDANGHTTRWTYDGGGRVISRRLPLGMTEALTYDAQGNRVSHTDFNAHTTTYTYDVDNRFVMTHYADGSTVERTYTPTGRLATVTDRRGVTTYHYDERDRLITLVYPDGTTLQWAYDAVGNRTELITPAGTTQYTYDPLGRLHTVTDPRGGVTTYGYDPSGNLLRTTYPHGTISYALYDTQNRLTRLEHLHADGQVFARYAYTLSPTGHRVRMEELSGQTFEYTYDAVARLVREGVTAPRVGQSATTYTYDAVGNRLSKSVNGVAVHSTYDANDRLLQEGSATYTYDRNGNTLQRLDPTGTTLYAYDMENRLVTVTTPRHTTHNTYDAFGVRVRAVRDNVVSSYVVDTQRELAQVVEEWNDRGTVVASYVYGHTLLSQERAGAVAYHHPDGLGSTRLLTDLGAQVTDTYTYEAFGTLQEATGTTVNPYQFAGEHAEPAIDAYYLRARYYQPGSGRFLTRDAFPGQETDPPTLHPYLYARANPVTFTDPSGYYSLQHVMGAQIARAPLTNLASLNAFRLHLKTAAATIMVSAWVLAVKGDTMDPFVELDANPVSELGWRAIDSDFEQQTQNRRFAIFISGSDTPWTTAHVEHAIHWGASAALHRRIGRHGTRWLSKKPECNKEAKRLFPPDSMQCDEYPFATTWEGGRDNYKEGTTLKLVPKTEIEQGQMLKAMYERCPVFPTIIRPTPAAPDGLFRVVVSWTRNTGYICPSGQRLW